MTARAVMKTLNTVTLIDDNSYSFSFDWHLMDNAVGGSFGVIVPVTFLWTDTLATVQTKIIDSIVAEALTRDMILARTSVLLINYGKGT